MPQSFQVICASEIPVAMHGVCCQISKLEELSVLLPGHQIRLCDSFQTRPEANATISPLECNNNLHTCPWTECWFPLSLQLNYCNILTPSNLFSPFSSRYLFLSFLVIATVFRLRTPVLLSHQLSLSTVAPSGPATRHCTSGYWVPSHSIFSLHTAVQFKFLCKTWFQ